MPVFYYGNGEATNLENDIGFDKNGQKIRTGIVTDPTVVAQAGAQGSMLMRTNGDVYIKNDAGTTTDWTIVSKSAATLNYTPTIPANWPVVPTKVTGALDELILPVDYTHKGLMAVSDKQKLDALPLNQLTNSSNTLTPTTVNGLGIENATIYTLSNPRNVWVVGGYAWVTTKITPGSLICYNVTDKVNPVLLSTIPLVTTQTPPGNSGPAGLVVDSAGRYVYVSMDTGNVNVFDYLDKANPVFVGVDISIEAQLRAGSIRPIAPALIGKAFDLDLHPTGNYILFSDAGAGVNANGFYIWDVSNKAAMVQLYNQPTAPVGGPNVALRCAGVRFTPDGNYVLVNEFATSGLLCRLLVYDWTNKLLAPIYIGGAFCTNGGLGSLTVSADGNTAYASNRNGTLSFFIFDITTKAAPTLTSMVDITAYGGALDVNSVLPSVVNNNFLWVFPVTGGNIPIYDVTIKSQPKLIQVLATGSGGLGTATEYNGYVFLADRVPQKFGIYTAFDYTRYIGALKTGSINVEEYEQFKANTLLTTLKDGAFEYDGTNPYFTIGAVRSKLIRQTDIAALNALTLEPTGFTNPDLVVINYNPAAQTISLTGTVVAYYQGVQVAAINNAYVSAAHTNTTGHIYWLYHDGSVFAWSTDTFPGFDKILIAVVNYGATDKYAIRECHGMMPYQAHRDFHATIGTYRESGGDLAGYVLASTTAANRRPTVSACTIWDEDLKTINPLLNSSLYTKTFLTGTTASPVTNYTVSTADIVPLLAANPYYNFLTGGNWTQTLMANNTYMCVWLIAVPVTASAASQAYRYLWMQGQSNGTLASQQALSPNSLVLGTLAAESSEFIFINRVIINFSGANWNIAQVDSLTGTRFIQAGGSGGGLTSITTDLTLDGTGTVGSPLTVVPQGHNDNIILNGNVLIDAAGWTASSANITVVRNTTTPLAPTADLLITVSNTAATTDYVQYGPIAISNGDQKGVVRQLLGDYITGGGFVDGTLGVYLWDGSNYIYPADPTISATSITNSLSKFFQFPYAVTPLYLRFKVNAVPAVAATMNVAGVYLGKRPIVKGVVETDWAPYTPSIVGFGTPTNIDFVWKRSGSDLLIKGKFTSGTSTAVEANIALPLGKTIVTTAVNTLGLYGTFSSRPNYSGVVTGTGGDTYFKMGALSTALSDGTLQASLGNSITISGDKVSLIARFPIVGWSSNMILSEDTGNRRIAFYGKGNAGQTLTADVTNCPFIMVEDTSGSWSGSVFTSPETGDYEYSGGIYSGSTNCYIGTYKNGVAYEYSNLATTSEAAHLFNGRIRLLKGETLSFRPNAGMTLVNVVTAHYLSIAKLATPQTIAASENVNASYWCSANFNASASIPVNFDSKDYDSHNAVTVSPTNWRFTAPRSGLYSIKFVTEAGGTGAYVRLYKSGSYNKSLGYLPTGGDFSSSADLLLNAGEYFDIRLSGARTMFGSANLYTDGITWISIKAE